MPVAPTVGLNLAVNNCIPVPVCALLPHHVVAAEHLTVSRAGPLARGDMVALPSCLIFGFLTIYRHSRKTSAVLERANTALVPVFLLFAVILKSPSCGWRGRRVKIFGTFSVADASIVKGREAVRRFAAVFFKKNRTPLLLF